MHYCTCFILYYLFSTIFSLAGLHLLIPDELIGIFDENELEVNPLKWIPLLYKFSFFSIAPNVWSTGTECG